MNAVEKALLEAQELLPSPAKYVQLAQQHLPLSLHSQKSH